jgi:hypothetical protein
MSRRTLSASADERGVVYFTIIYPPLYEDDPTSKPHLDIALSIYEIDHSHLSVREMLQAYEESHGTAHLKGGRLFVRGDFGTLIPYEEFE